ncbi:hypothetical protein BKM20_28370 [Pseudomonas avellanae]|uniref:Uncharacterized protein n=2 Tax=Pseudomonas avellanae TaxID=46257 RepID=A0AAD0DWI8_9PSED|nr:hypothetical protein BKM03_00060 [Pseudomonas avellanae]EGH10512.1 hypothetical protein PSYMP_13814 [Pseudomonas amygdali pv. morsprunorum str. M302280]KWS72943.1 hypothetical protein AL055_11795 [Pseudomonas amygdali pv. morsprunorum]PHN41192.1 hypothetical protein AO261_10880 [Pseudomonas avellanae]POC81761.1 hypothetical protein BKM26_28355 [Pseudomonas avellanae]
MYSQDAGAIINFCPPDAYVVAAIVIGTVITASFFSWKMRPSREGLIEGAWSTQLSQLSDQKSLLINCMSQKSPTVRLGFRVVR